MTTQTKPKYINLIADGIGFLNRPRQVEGKKVEPYYACTINAARGADEYTRFDVRITGEEAKKLFENLLSEFPKLQSDNLKDRPTVTCGFRIGDINPISFDVTDRRTGELKKTILSIDGRLIRFKWIKVNGKFWHNEKEVQENPNPEQDFDDDVPF